MQQVNCNYKYIHNDIYNQIFKMYQEEIKVKFQVRLHKQFEPIVSNCG